MPTAPSPTTTHLFRHTVSLCSCPRSNPCSLLQDPCSALWCSRRKHHKLRGLNAHAAVKPPQHVCVNRKARQMQREGDPRREGGNEIPRTLSLRPPLLRGFPLRLACILSSPTRALRAFSFLPSAVCFSVPTDRHLRSKKSSAREVRVRYGMR